MLCSAAARPRPEQSRAGACAPCHPLGSRTHIWRPATPLDAVTRCVWAGGPAASPGTGPPSRSHPTLLTGHPASQGSSLAEPASPCLAQGSSRGLQDSEGLPGWGAASPSVPQQLAATPAPEGKSPAPAARKESKEPRKVMRSPPGGEGAAPMGSTALTTNTAPPEARARPRRESIRLGECSCLSTRHRGSEPQRFQPPVTRPPSHAPDGDLDCDLCHC